MNWIHSQVNIMITIAVKFKPPWVGYCYQPEVRHKPKHYRYLHTLPEHNNQPIITIFILSSLLLIRITTNIVTFQEQFETGINCDWKQHLPFKSKLLANTSDSLANIIVYQLYHVIV